jgi:hypothetical protein
VRNGIPRGLDVDAEPNLGPVPESVNPNNATMAPGDPARTPSRGGSPRVSQPGRRPATLGDDREFTERENTDSTEGHPGLPGVGHGPRSDPPGQSGMAAQPGEPQKLPEQSGAPVSVVPDVPGERLPKKQSPFRTGTPGREMEQGGLRSEPRSAASRSNGDRAGLRWGNTGGATIGLEQDVKVHVHHDRLVIEDRPALGIPAGASRQQLADSFNNRIEEVVSEWGPPPRRFHWMPRIRFVVHPGGNQQYERLNDAVKQWKLSSTVDFSLDASQTSRPQKSTPVKK